MTVEVSGFQINDYSILTVKEPNGTLITSGIFPTSCPSPDAVDVDFGDVGHLLVRVEKWNDDPEVVGAVPNQLRRTWKGNAELEP